MIFIENSHSLRVHLVHNAAVYKCLFSTNKKDAQVVLFCCLYIIFLGSNTHTYTYASTHTQWHCGNKKPMGHNAQLS